MLQQINLTIPPGVVRGATQATTPGRWYDANLVRWQSGGLTPIGGWSVINSVGSCLSTPRAMLPWLDLGGIRRTGIVCDGHVHLLEATQTSVTNITPSGFQAASLSTTQGGYGNETYNTGTYGTGRTIATSSDIVSFSYSLGTWGQDLLICASSDGRLLYWSPSTPGALAQEVTNAPNPIRAFAVTDERHVLAVGGGLYPRRIQWCSRENIEDWNYSSTTNTAGFLDLDTEDALIGAVNVRDGILVFSESDVFLVRYVGLPFVYGAERIAHKAAPINAQAVAVFEGRAAWLGREGMWIYDGGSVRSLPCTVGDYLFQTIDRASARLYATASSNGLFNEVWWFYPSAAGENNRYLIWNYAEDWWSIGALARSAMCPAGVFSRPFAATTAGQLFQHENGYLAAGATRVGTVYAETSAMSLGDGAKVMTVLRAQPDSMMGATKTQFRFYGRFTREGSETSFGPYTTRSDGYMDIRLTARDVRMRVEATANEDWTIGGMRLTIADRGER